MSHYGEIFSDAVPGVKEKKPRKTVDAVKRSYVRREKAAPTPVVSAPETPSEEETDILAGLLGEYNAEVYHQAAVVVELLAMIPEDRRRRAAELIMKMQKGTLKFF